MKNTVVTTGAKMKSGGTGSAWFHTNDEKLEQKHVDIMLEKFPEISEIYSISLTLRKNGVNKKTGVYDSEFRHVENGLLSE